MNQQSDDQGIRKNVADGFRALVDRIMDSSVPPSPEVEGKIQVAFETWQTGQHNLTTSLLLDVLINLYAERARG